jgi:hypothetical protein
MKNEGWADCPSSFHDTDEVGPTILSKTAEKPERQPNDH